MTSAQPATTRTATPRAGGRRGTPRATRPRRGQVGAFFDFDGTLIDGFSALAFYRHRLGRLEIGPAEAAQLLLVGLRGIDTQEEFAQGVAMSLRAWEGRSDDEIAELGERIFTQNLSGAIFPESWRLVRDHLAQGHVVVIATAATRYQVDPMARALGVEHVICTPTEVEDGILTGRAGGPVPYAEGKAEAVRAFAAEHGVDLKRSYAYSNGAEDVPFLEAVGHPQVINPEKELERTAQARGWPVHRFATRGRPGVDRIARTLGAWTGFFAGVGTGAVLGLLNGSHRQGVDLGLSFAGDLGLALAGIDVDVQGTEHLWSHRPAVFVFNHQSSLIDAMVTFKLLRTGYTGVAKKEAAAVPVVGQILSLAQVVFVDRGNSTNPEAALAPAVERLREGVSVAIAPEGTRSHTPALGAFKKGAFHMAMQAGVPIVPIVIRNAGELMWRNAKTLRSGVVQVVVHPPIPTHGWTAETIGEHVEEVRQIFQDTLDHWPAAPAEGTGP